MYRFSLSQSLCLSRIKGSNTQIHGRAAEITDSYRHDGPGLESWLKPANENKLQATPNAKFPADGCFAVMNSYMKHEIPDMYGI